MKTSTTVTILALALPSLLLSQPLSSLLTGMTQDASAVDSVATATDMNGMPVVATFTNGTTDTVVNFTWGPVSTGGGVTDGISNGFSVTVFGADTFTSQWNFNNLLGYNGGGLGLKKLEFDGQPAGIGFDYQGSLTSGSTPGSGSGLEPNPIAPFNWFNPYITFTFSDAVAVAGNPPEGDLYRRLTVDFLDNPSDFSTFFKTTEQYTIDTDKVSYSAVPEPGAFPVLAGLLAMLTARLRRA